MSCAQIGNLTLMSQIHNTFGEKHVHVLRTGKGEDDERERPPGYVLASP